MNENNLTIEDEYIQIGNDETYSIYVNKHLTDLTWSPTKSKAKLFEPIELKCNGFKNNGSRDCGKKLIVHPDGLAIEIADGSSQWAEFDPALCTAMYWWIVNNREIPFEV